MKLVWGVVTALFLAGGANAQGTKVINFPSVTLAKVAGVDSSGNNGVMTPYALVGAGVGAAPSGTLTSCVGLISGVLSIGSCPSGGGTPGGSSGQVQYNNAGSFGGFTFGGDITVVPSTGLATLAASGATAGSYTNANITINAKGIVTAASNGSSSGGVSSVTGGIGITASPTTGAVVLSAALTQRNNTTTSDALASSDAGKVITENNASAVAVSIAQAGTTGFASGQYWTLKNKGAGVATLTPTTSTVDGGGTIACKQNQSADIYSDGTNYQTLSSTCTGLTCSYTPVTTGTQSVAYTGGTPSAAGGAPSYTFSETGSLPTGLSISSSTGIISGTPSANGTFTGIQVKVTDSASSVVNCGSAFTLTIAAPPTFSMTYVTGGSAQASGGSTTINYGALNTASGCTRVVIANGWVPSGGTDTITGISVGGVSSSQVPSAYINNGGVFATDIWETTGVVSGTSPVVQVTYSAAPGFNSSVALYCLVTGTPTASMGTKGSAASGTTVTLSPSPTVPSGGGGIVVSAASQALSSITNATVDATVSAGGNPINYAHITGTGTPTVTATYASSTAGTLSAATWAP